MRSFTYSLLPALFVALCPQNVASKDECQPVTWEDPPMRRFAATPVAPAPPSITYSNRIDDPEAGDVNCQIYKPTYSEVNYYSCMKLAVENEISVADFFLFNPELERDCSNLRPYTFYCVAGFIEPLRAWDGKCGPSNNNATCEGTDLECCNSETWTCGMTWDDCAAGVCYEGFCPGDKVYSTDGTCGWQHGLRLCAGKWGDCCNHDGKCGTGQGFCDKDSCQGGNCTVPIGPPPVIPEPYKPGINGNSTDGTCGGEDGMTCNLRWGSCCTKDGICSPYTEDCGPGCQPDFGKCDEVPAFHVKASRHSDCSGDVHNNIDVTDGVCIETDCQVASLDLAGAGSCPDGEIRISYWDGASCQGKWYGYGYASRDTCRTLWSAGWNFKSLWLSCAKPQDDCVNQGTCSPDPEPETAICSAPTHSDVAFSVKGTYHNDCTGKVNNDVSIKKNTGMCINTNCAVASLDTSGVGDCAVDQVRVSYWENADCKGDWYGYDYTSRDTCFRLWTDGYKYKSLYLSCADKSSDCVTEGSCKAEPEPAKSIC